MRKFVDRTSPPAAGLPPLKTFTTAAYAVDKEGDTGAGRSVKSPARSMATAAFEGREVAHPLRPGWRRLAKDRRGREVPFGIALPALLGLVLKRPQQSAPPKVSLHASDQPPQHLTHFARPEMPEPLEAPAPPLSVNNSGQG